MRQPRTPADLVRRFAAIRARERAEEFAQQARAQVATVADGWTRETYRLPRDEAARTAQDWFERYPKAAYGTEVERWQVDGEVVEFTIRRLAVDEPPRSSIP